MHPSRDLKSGAPLISLLSAAGLGCAGGLQQTRDTPSPAELATLEIPHQRQGEPLPGLPESARPAKPLHLSYRVCVEGAQGRAFDVQPLQESAVADPILLPALRVATWQVSGLDGPACFLENLESSAEGTFRTVPQPFIAAASERLPQASDANPELPLSVQQRLVGKSVVGLYRMCLPKDSGAVSAVTPVVGIPGADAEVATVLRSWRYKPSSEAPCWLEPLLFTLNGAKEQSGTAPVNALPTQANTGLINKLIR